MGLEKGKVGAIICLNGSVILMIVGLYWISMGRFLYPSYPGYSIIIPYITALLNIALSAFGITGSVLVLRDLSWGYIFPLVAAILGIIGSLIPIYVYDTGWGYIYYSYLVNTAMFIDLALMLVGGILGLALSEKKERF